MVEVFPSDPAKSEPRLFNADMGHWMGNFSGQYDFWVERDDLVVARHKRANRIWIFAKR
jgi:hypothetical protein